MIIFFILADELILERNNVVRIKQKKIASKVNLSRKSIPKLIKKLIDIGLIAKINNGYMLNPRVITKEYPSSNAKTLAIWRRITREV